LGAVAYRHVFVSRFARNKEAPQKILILLTETEKKTSAYNHQ